MPGIELEKANVFVEKEPKSKLDKIPHKPIPYTLGLDAFHRTRGYFFALFFVYSDPPN